MIRFNLQELLKYDKQIQISADTTIEHVSTNSKDLDYSNCMFVALKGQRFDGHDFIDESLLKKVVALGIDKKHDYTKPSVKLDDTQRLLGLIGKCVKDKSRAKMLAITGTCGKTSVKQMTYNILSNEGASIATEGNLNNDIGVPLSLMQINEDTKFAIIEQGASHKGDIKRTCEFVGADIALITNVGNAHLQGFGSIDGVYEAKSEILEDVFANNGLGIVNADSPFYERWCHDFQSFYKQGKLFSFGFNQQASVVINDLKSYQDAIELSLSSKIFDLNLKLKLNLLGDHNAQNASAAALMATLAGAGVDSIYKGLSHTKPVEGRLQKILHKNFTIINDAYNASYNSVISAIDTLANQKGYKVMILADMGELGQSAQSLHDNLANYAKNLVDEYLTIGNFNKIACSKAGFGKNFSDHESIMQEARELLKKHENVVFLVKGSHSFNMEQIVAQLGKL